MKDREYKLQYIDNEGDWETIETCTLASDAYLNLGRQINSDPDACYRIIVAEPRVICYCPSPTNERDGDEARP